MPTALMERRRQRCGSPPGDDGHNQDGTVAHRKHTQQVKAKRAQVSHLAGKSQLPSFILFVSLIVLINLCPSQIEEPNEVATPFGAIQSEQQAATATWRLQQHDAAVHSFSCITYLRSGVDFVRLMFSQPLRLNKRITRFTLAEARVLGKMAKVWYIKKKIKKLSKKLKKHTIAVPVFTAIPIYEHSYYPQPHVTHVSHGAMHHAASSYAPATVAQMTAAASSMVPVTSAAAAVGSSQQQQMATSASNQHQVAAYRMAPHRPYAGGGGAAMYQPAGSAHHIINAYAPSPPLFVDDTGGLYGHYGNAYGRYDGGYHIW